MGVKEELGKANETVFALNEEIKEFKAKEEQIEKEKYTKVSDSLKKATTSALESITKLTSWFN